MLRRTARSDEGMTPEKKFTPEEIDALYAPFPITEHNIREGSRNRAKTKIQWFVYADRVAVQKRLDALFPGEWEFNPLREHRDDKYMSVVAEIVIRGVRRGYNGGGSLNYSGDTFDEDTEKGAMTDTFRRVASLWGIGLYLYDGPQIWTDAYPDGDWNAKRAIEADAKRQFADWYEQRYGKQPATPPARAQLVETAKSNLGPAPKKTTGAPRPAVAPPDWAGEKNAKADAATNADAYDQIPLWQNQVVSHFKGRAYRNGKHVDNAVAMLTAEGTLKGGETLAELLAILEARKQDEGALAEAG
jgi:hypothetical protein